jgi:hypothetical protein
LFGDGGVRHAGIVGPGPGRHLSEACSQSVFARCFPRIAA